MTLWRLREPLSWVQFPEGTLPETGESAVFVREGVEAAATVEAIVAALKAKGYYPSAVDFIESRFLNGSDDA